jgi:hypothetical protein
MNFMKNFLSGRKDAGGVPPNHEFVKKIMPDADITFAHDKYISAGDGYEMCVYVYRYRSPIDYHWLRDLTNFDDAIVAIDVSTHNPARAKASISKSMEEQTSRMNSAKSNAEYMDAERMLDDLARMYKELAGMGKVMKVICTRIFVPRRTLAEADEEAKKILNTLEGEEYKGKISLNEGESDWKSLFLPFRAQQKTPYKKSGQAVLTPTLAIGNCFHYSKLDDPSGKYYGTTATGGSVFLDTYCVTDMRMSYDIFVSGKKGTGKSALLKRMVDDRATRGDTVRIFDVVGDYGKLVEHYGGKTVSLSDETINALQIFKTGETAGISYNRHISKVTTFYNFLNPEATHQELRMFGRLVRKLYVRWGLLSEKEELREDITALKVTEYPIWSDFLELIGEELERYRARGETNALEYRLTEAIELDVNTICTDYKNIFDAHTSVENLPKEQLVSFDIHDLAAMEPTIFDAQLFSGLILTWDNLMITGMEMKRLYDAREIDRDEITRFFVPFDEVERFINARKLFAVGQMQQFMNEGRKWFGGIALGTPNLGAFIPENSSAAGVAQMKSLFALTTYKFTFNQDESSYNLIADAFRNQFTPQELDQVPRLSRGQAILSIAGENNILLNIDIPPEKLALYGGGA